MWSRLKMQAVGRWYLVPLGVEIKIKIKIKIESKSKRDMKILAMDTTTDICSITLGDENGVLAEHNFASKRTLSQRMMVDIQSMMADCGLEMKDLSGLAVSLGPGSFTGLRIGVVTAKTLAQVLNLPAVGIVSLDALAHQFDYLPSSIVCPIIKVRKGEAYYAFYRTHSGQLERISDYAADTIEVLAEQARGIEGGSIIFCGDALDANLPALRDLIGDRVVSAAQWLNYPKASILCRLAVEKISAGEASDPLTLVPFYMRKSTPEIRLECSGGKL